MVIIKDTRARISESFDVAAKTIGTSQRAGSYEGIRKSVAGFKLPFVKGV